MALEMKRGSDLGASTSSTGVGLGKDWQERWVEWVKSLVHPDKTPSYPIQQWYEASPKQGGWGLNAQTLEHFGVGLAWLPKDGLAGAKENFIPESQPTSSSPFPHFLFPRRHWMLKPNKTIGSKGSPSSSKAEAITGNDVVGVRLVPWNQPKSYVEEDARKEGEKGTVGYSSNLPNSSSLQDQKLEEERWTRALDNASCQFLPPLHQRSSHLPGLFAPVSFPSSQSKRDAPGEDSNSCVVITAKEEDAMAVWQETGIPAVSLPTLGYQLPLDVLPLLESTSKVFLWLGSDAHARSASSLFARKLGIQRCWLVGGGEGSRGSTESAAPGAWECMARGMSLRDTLDGARRLAHRQILSFSQLREGVWREVQDPEGVQGIQSKTMPGLNAILKGHRPGELTIVTGGTGVGKTTVVSQLSLDYCANGGVPTLWGSFEIPNVRLAKRMLYQYAGTDLTQAPPSTFDKWADQFEALPLYFLRFFGSTRVDEVVEAMTHALHAHDIQHVIVDNLQFMISGQGQGWERWEVQDEALSVFRRFASEHGVHVTMVVHPRKDDRDVLELNSIFGSAKTTQEADNVVILQSGSGFRYLDIRKNR